jgi:hypothetical protein
VPGLSGDLLVAASSSVVVVVVRLGVVGIGGGGDAGAGAVGGPMHGKEAVDHVDGVSGLLRAVGLHKV